MAIQKVESEVHIKASAEQFFDIFCNKTHIIANIFPERILSIEVHEGEWGTEESIISWKFLHEGKSFVAKEVVEGIDREKNKVTFNVIESDLLLAYFKSFKFTMQATPKEKGSVVHWVIEYEKQKDHVSDPYAMLQLIVEETTKVDAYLTKE